MRRANGDWFALENQARLLVPLFHSSHDALMARLRNVGMLVFQPVALDARLLKEIISVNGAPPATFCIVKDPFASLSLGWPIEPAQLATLIGLREPLPRSGNGNQESDVLALQSSELRVDVSEARLARARSTL
ncbi:MAG: hypothetical protein ACXW18_00700 [Pyrinomonadaceae bacterium]